MSLVKLIIDGYNLLKLIIGSDVLCERERNRFIETIARYSHKKKLPILLVFDGGPSMYPQREKHNGVEIVFSGIKESADDYIKQYVQDIPAHNVMLISSDRELVNFVNYYGVDALDSQSFYTFMQEALLEPEVRPMVQKTEGAAKKLHPEDVDQELDELMQEAATFIVRKADDVSGAFEQATQQKIAKKERLRVQKIKKL